MTIFVSVSLSPRLSPRVPGVGAAPAPSPMVPHGQLGHRMTVTLVRPLRVPSLTDPCCSRPGTGHCFTQIFIHGLTRAHVGSAARSARSAGCSCQSPLQSVLDSGAEQTCPLCPRDISLSPGVSGPVSRLTSVSSSDQPRPPSQPQHEDCRGE